MADGMTQRERLRWRQIDGIAQTKDEQAFCRDLEARGFLTCYDSMFGNLYFHLTRAGEQEIYR